jgi:hypothetical protein
MLPGMEMNVSYPSHHYWSWFKPQRLAPFL